MRRVPHGVGANTFPAPNFDDKVGPRFGTACLKLSCQSERRICVVNEAMAIDDCFLRPPIAGERRALKSIAAGAVRDIKSEVLKISRDWRDSQ